LANKRSPRTFFHFLANLVKRTAWLYSVSVSLLLLLWLLTGERLFFVNMFVNLLPAAFYPMLVLLPLMLVMRIWRVVLLLLPAAIVFACLYAPAFLPKVPVAPSSAPEITVLTYNILAINRNLDAVARVILDTDADIVAIQEAQIEFQTYAETHLAERYPYIASFQAPGTPRYEGRMLLSKYPILNAHVAAGYARTILYLRAEIDVSGETIALYNVHLHPPSPRWIFSTAARHGDLEVLLAETTQETLPTLIVGDFNMTDATADYRLIASQYIDTYRERGDNIGTSHPNGGVLHHRLSVIPSFIRIDYIFHDAAFTAVDTQVIRAGSSDHFPLWARLRLGD
jgi:vancomycin resistance protein VanJ